MKDAKSCSVKFPRQLVLGLARNGNVDACHNSAYAPGNFACPELTPGGQLGQVGINAVQWWRVLGANRRKHAVPLWDKSSESIPREGSWGADLASLVCGCPEC